MKYFAFVEDVEDLAILKGTEMNQCPTMETAIAVSIMANREHPLIAVSDSNGEIITIDPRSETVTIDGLMKAEFILVELDKNGVPVLSTSDTIPFSVHKHSVLVNYSGNKYIEAIPNCDVARNNSLKIADIDSESQPHMIIQQSVEYGIAPFTFKRQAIAFGGDFRMFRIIGTPDKHVLKLKMDGRFIPSGKLLVLDDRYGDATHMYWISLFSDLVRIYEENGQKHDYHFYVQGDKKGELIQLRHVKTEEVDL